MGWTQPWSPGGKAFQVKKGDQLLLQNIGASITLYLDTLTWVKSLKTLILVHLLARLLLEDRNGWW